MTIADQVESFDATKHFDVFGKRWLTTPEVRINLSREMYRPADNADDHWLALTFLGFQAIRGTAAVASNGVVAIIGTSSGLDAIGAIEAFDPRVLVVTDVIPEVLPIALANVERCCCGHVTVRALPGHLLQPLKASGVVADLIYENLPNLPLRSDGAQTGTGIEAASFFAVPANGSKPPRLELHESFLRDVREVLSSKGCVLCAIGARVPWDEIRAMFLGRGFIPEIASYVLKPQEQADECLPRYSELERPDRPFIFYELAPARTALETAKPRRPGEAVLDESIADELEELLYPYRLTAKEANDFHRRQKELGRECQVGHLAFLVLGRSTE